MTQRVDVSYFGSRNTFICPSLDVQRPNLIITVHVDGRDIASVRAAVFGPSTSQTTEEEEESVSLTRHRLLSSNVLFPPT